MYSANFATPAAREESNVNTNAARGPRYNMPAIGARAALDFLKKHFQALKEGTEDFIPTTPDGEYTIETALSGHRYANGQTGMWECGGSMGAYGACNVIAGPDAQPLNPLHQHHVNPEHACDKHVLLPVKEGYIMAHAAFAEGNVLITAWRCETLAFDAGDNPERGGVTRATFKLIYAADGIDALPLFLAEEEEATPDNQMFQAFLKAAWTKANMFRCQSQVWAYPWAPWIVKKGGREWDLPEIVAAQEGIIEALTGVGLSDPDPKSVVTDYNTMVAEIEDAASKAIYKFRNASSNPRGPRVHVLQYFTQEENSSKVRVTNFVLLHNIKTPKILATRIYYADPNTTMQSERPEPAYYLNNRRFMRWDLIKSKFADEATGGECKFVYEYTGC